MKNVFIDLFSGLGGASYAFDESKEWITIKIDNNPELLDYNRGMYLMNISDTDEIIRMIQTQLPLKANLGKVVVWASPPCQQFSYANANRNHTQTAEDFDLSLFDAALDIIEILKPDHWIIENVLGAVQIVDNEYSMLPTQQIGHIVLWGDFPLISIRDQANFKHNKFDAKGSRTLRPNWRAKIPQSVSFGLLETLTQQKTLHDFTEIR